MPKKKKKARPPEMTPLTHIENFIETKATLNSTTEKELVELIKTQFPTIEPLNEQLKEQLKQVLNSSHLIQKLIEYSDVYKKPLLTLCCLKTFTELKRDDWLALIKLPHIIHILCWSTYQEKQKDEEAILNATIANLLKKQENGKLLLKSITPKEWKTILSQPHCINILVGTLKHELSREVVQVSMDHKNLHLISKLKKDQWEILSKSAMNYVLQMILAYYAQGLYISKDALAKKRLLRNLVTSGALKSLESLELADKRFTWQKFSLQTRTGLKSILEISQYPLEKCETETETDIIKFIRERKTTILDTLTIDDWKGIIIIHGDLLLFNDVRKIFQEKNIFQQIPQETWVDIMCSEYGLRNLVKVAHFTKNYAEFDALIESGALIELKKDREKSKQVAHRLSEILPRISPRSPRPKDKVDTQTLLKQVLRLEILHLAPSPSIEKIVNSSISFELYKACRDRWEPHIIALEERTTEKIAERLNRAKPSVDWTTKLNKTGVSKKRELLGDKGYLCKEDFITLYRDLDKLEIISSRLDQLQTLWLNALEFSATELLQEDPDTVLTLTEMLKIIGNAENNDILIHKAISKKIYIEALEAKLVQHEDIGERRKEALWDKLWQALREYIPYGLLLGNAVRNNKGVPVNFLDFATKMLTVLIQQRTGPKAIDAETLEAICWEAQGIETLKDINSSRAEDTTATAQVPAGSAAVGPKKRKGTEESAQVPAATVPVPASTAVGQPKSVRGPHDIFTTKARTQPPASSSDCKRKAPGSGTHPQREQKLVKRM
jgi:hypothetical protein